jgi:hypothetical protein
MAANAERQGQGTTVEEPDRPADPSRQEPIHSRNSDNDHSILFGGSGSNHAALAT